MEISKFSSVHAALNHLSAQKKPEPEALPEAKPEPEPDEAPCDPCDQAANAASEIMEKITAGPEAEGISEESLKEAQQDVQAEAEYKQQAEVEAAKEHIQHRIDHGWKPAQYDWANSARRSKKDEKLFDVSDVAANVLVRDKLITGKSAERAMLEITGEEHKMPSPSERLALANDNSMIDRERHQSEIFRLSQERDEWRNKYETLAAQKGDVAEIAEESRKQEVERQKEIESLKSQLSTTKQSRDMYSRKNEEYKRTIGKLHAKLNARATRHHDK